MEKLIEKLLSLNLKSVDKERLDEIVEEYENKKASYRGMFMFLKDIVSHQSWVIRHLFPKTETRNLNHCIVEEVANQEGVRDAFEAILENEKLFAQKLNECNQFVDDLVKLPIT